MNKHLDQSGIEVAILPAAAPTAPRARDEAVGPAPIGFRVVKRSIDILLALAAMPLVIVSALLLMLMNPIWNAGPLFFMQTRMGRDCRPFRAIKFRTMRPASQILRGPDDPLESDRITPLGQFLRRTRTDELPQFVNVLVGDMSVIGPRPDYWDHAQHYTDTIPGYRQRHMVRPGITGLAQVDGGYAEGINATVEKTRHDLRYIRGAGLGMELYVIWRTFIVLFTGYGAR